MDKSLSSGKKGGGQYPSRKLYKGNIMIKQKFQFIVIYAVFYIGTYIIFNLTDKNNVYLCQLYVKTFVYILAVVCLVFSVVCG